ncbi:hypothetical protein FRC03_010181 [Tulasnella sp. 419]|nr:hypothetical protein FRC02_008918 [Tulasnella sp. 418]KAG8967336.1 hypothetical protein FRC03_010181 [Tulasnella sp. 419]
MAALPASDLNKVIQDKYGSIADHQLNDSPQSDVYNKVAQAFGYTEFDLASLPDGANMGLSCGNPIGVANIKEGETVVDLGCGGGLDVLLAASKVGPTGQVIGLDMSESMLTLARRNAEKAGLKPPQASFKACVLPQLPLESGLVNLFLSNCVLNLLAEDGKKTVWQEMHRALKPGGRVVISDILAKKEMPAEMRNDVSQWVGCISGASLVEEYRSYISGAGFSEIRLIPTGVDLSIYSSVPGLGDEEGKPAATSCCSTVPTAESQPPAKTCCKSNSQEIKGPSERICCTSPSASLDVAEVNKDGNGPMPDVNEFVGSYVILAVKA